MLPYLDSSLLEGDVISKGIVLNFLGLCLGGERRGRTERTKRTKRKRRKRKRKRRRQRRRKSLTTLGVCYNTISD
jgi:hypothetical protein